MSTKRHVAGKTALSRAAGAGGRLPRGYGAMRDVPLDLDPRIDLTKPIYEQAAALQESPRKSSEKPR